MDSLQLDTMKKGDDVYGYIQEHESPLNPQNLYWSQANNGKEVDFVNKRGNGSKSIDRNYETHAEVAGVELSRGRVVYPKAVYELSTHTPRQIALAIRSLVPKNSREALEGQYNKGGILTSLEVGTVHEQFTSLEKDIVVVFKRKGSDITETALVYGASKTTQGILPRITDTNGVISNLPLALESLMIVEDSEIASKLKDANNAFRVAENQKILNKQANGYQQSYNEDGFKFDIIGTRLPSGIMYFEPTQSVNFNNKAEKTAYKKLIDSLNSTYNRES